jgi:hypothetical protein
MMRLVGTQSKVNADGTTTLSVPWSLYGSFASPSAADLYLGTALPQLEGFKLLDSFAAKQVGTNDYEVTANYKGADDETPDQNDPNGFRIGEKSVQFEIMSIGKHMKYSLDNIAKIHRMSSATAEDFDGAINVVDGVPEGVDLDPATMAEFSFDVEVVGPTSAITNSWLQGIQSLVGKTNNAAFRGRDVGEVMFAGIRGTVELLEPVNALSFQFYGIENFAGDIGPFLNVQKLGWHYAWIWSITETEAGKEVSKPQSIYVERVFDEADFSGIPVLQ